MTWVETHGKPLATDQSFYLRFRNGLTSKRAYPAFRIRWTHTGSGEDVIAVRPSE